MCISRWLTTDASINTKSPIRCPSGSFCSIAVKSSAISNNLASFYSPRTCLQGFVCKSGDSEMFDNENTCEVGKFCPGSSLPYDSCNNNEPCEICNCLLGHSCPLEGMSAPQECTKGTYQDACMQSSCKSCPKGHFCNSNKIDNVNVFWKDCEPGYYCEEGAIEAVSCEPGTYQNLARQSSCFECPKGFYCPNQQMTDPTNCDPGFICNELRLSEGIACTEGYYCEAGVDFYINLAEFIECDNQKYKCPTPCPAGSMCPSGSSNFTQCPLGYYQDETRQSGCKKCPKGYICNLVGLSNPVLCTPGYYCEDEGLYDPTEYCPAGYYCLEGTISGESSLFPKSTLRQLAVFINECEVVGNLKEPIPCHPGYYCPPGTGSADPNIPIGPRKCPSGTYNDRCMAGECTNCPSGYSCIGDMTISPTLCPLGKYRSGVSPNCEDCPQGT